MVRKERLELSRREALEPKSSVSTNSTTPALPERIVSLVRLINRKKWGGRWGSNPRPPESQSGALPTELRPPLLFAVESGAHIKLIAVKCQDLIIKFVYKFTFLLF